MDLVSFFPDRLLKKYHSCSLALFFLTPSSFVGAMPDVLSLSRRCFRCCVLVALFNWFSQNFHYENNHPDIIFNNLLFLYMYDDVLINDFFSQQRVGVAVIGVLSFRFVLYIVPQEE